MTSDQTPPGISLADLPRDELLCYGRNLGLVLDDRLPDGELLRRVRERQELLLTLDREAMLDIVVWARRPVRQSASREDLARHIASITCGNYADLSARGLVTLARLRGLEVRENMEPAKIVEALRRGEGLWAKVRRKRRAVVGSLLSKLIHEHVESNEEEYRFLPEDGATRSLKAAVEAEGMVGGIARRLRGVADDYVREKLDEIELRIDRKLDEIDRRLAEWRDREVSNRLKILKITLIVSILVALLGLGYDYVRWRVHGEVSPAATQVSQGDAVGKAPAPGDQPAQPGGER